MGNESRGLARGLGALLGAQPTVSASRGGGTLPIEMMQAGAFQPRRRIEREPLEELAASIKANGVIQPIVVRRLPDETASGVRYEIIAGERRWQAAKLAGLTDIPAIVRELSDRDAVAIALIENIQREELTAAEEARALKRLAEEFSLTHQAVADAVGRSRAAVSNLIRLLDLPTDVVALMDDQRLSMGQARALLALDEDAERIRVAQQVVSRGLSVRETESLVRRVLKGEGAVAGKPPELSVITEVLRTTAVRVELQQRASGRGKVVVEFEDAETRDLVLEAVRKAVEE